MERDEGWNNVEYFEVCIESGIACSAQFCILANYLFIQSRCVDDIKW